MPTSVRRRTLLRAALSSAALAVTGCAGRTLEQPPVTTAFPRTVIDAAGARITIPAPPRRVVVATEYSALDALLALGHPPVAAVRHYPTDWPWSLAAGSAEVPLIPESPDGPQPEQLARWEPDLLLLQNNLDEAVALALSGLAPTVQYNADDGRASLRTVADALGIPEAAEPIVAELDAQVAAARARISAAGRAGWTFTTFEPQGPDTAGFWGMGTDAAILLTDLGLRPSPLVAGRTGYGTLSSELLGQLDADLLLGRDIEFGGDDVFTVFESNPLFRTLPAVTRGRYRRLTVRDSWALGQSSILSWAAAVDLLEAIVLDVPA